MTDAQAPSSPAGPAEDPLRLVCLVASAGGLDPLKLITACLGPGLAGVVLILQHFPEDQASHLPDLLTASCALPVRVGLPGTVLAAGTLYVLGGGMEVEAVPGGLCLRRDQAIPTQDLPGDHLLRSAAAAVGRRAAGILLSGTGRDGTEGLRAIRDAGGMTLVQAPASAAYDGMARSAMEAGVAGRVLPPEELAVAIQEFCQGARPGAPGRSGGLPEICDTLTRLTGHDFHGYKQGTLLRRIQRRMRACQCRSLGEYALALEGNAQEGAALLADLLIGVTEFFRDPLAFEALGRALGAAQAAGGPQPRDIRAWVPGCATGEEAYSIAMVLSETLGDLRPLKVFATDIDVQALMRAKQGLYRAEDLRGVSAGRLTRFFEAELDGLRIRKELRACCLFSFHNLLQDPPFSDLDLISCRNLFIYLRPEVQERLVPFLHFALRPGGLLFLGPSDGTGALGELFEPLDGSHRIFRRRDAVRRPALVGLQRSLGEPGSGAYVRSPAPAMPVGSVGLFERLLLEEFVPPSAIVNAAGDVLYGAGGIGRHLAPALGTPTGNLVRGAGGALGTTLKALLVRAAAEPGGTAQAVVRDEAGTAPGLIRVLVRALPGMGRASGTFAVILRPEGPAQDPVPSGDTGQLDAPLLEQLDSELRATRAELQMTVEDLESANEELRSSNEELQTSQEELQSVNEELVVINRELQTKVQELQEANADLQNLFAATDIATLFLDGELRLARFTPAATALFGLQPTDAGRPIQDLAPRFTGLDLPAEARQVLADTAPRNRQVRSLDGDRHYLARLLPYRNLLQQVEGVVATFVDYTEIHRFQAALADREERLTRVQAGAQACTWEMDLGTGRLYWSPEFYRLLGLDPALEPSLDTWRTAVHPEDVARVLSTLGDLQVSDRVYENEYRVLLPDGRCRWVLSRGAVQPGPGPGRMAGLSLDITARKDAEVRLAVSEARLNSALHRSHTGAWAFDPTTGEAYRSPEHARIFGYEGLEDPWTFAIFLDHIHPDDRVRVREAIQAAMAAGRDWDLECRIRRRDGFPRWIRVAGGPDPGEGGAVARMAGVIQDISDRKEAEEARLKSERQFAAAFHGSPDAIAITHAETEVYQLVNESFSRMLGYTPDQVIGRSAKDLHVWLDLEDRSRWIATLQREGQVRSLESRFRKADGQILVAEISSRPFQMDEGSFILTLIRDLTQVKADQEARRTLEAEVAQIQKLESLGRLAGGVAHDMNNVLGAIFAVSQTLRARYGGDPTLDAALVTLERAAGRGRDLVKGLVGFSRKGTGAFLPLDLNDMVAMERDILDHTLLQKHQVETDLQPNLPLVQGDAGTLGSALMNLCVNAVDAMPAGGTLRIRTRVLPGGFVQLDVEDTGEGMPPEVLEKAMEPFFTTKPQGKGTGLGLAQVFTAVRAHGGQVSLRSEVGRGTCVTLVLPSTTSGALPAPETAQAETGAGREILLVDDDELVRSALPLMLELLGHRVRCAGGGPEALAMLREGWRPAVVLLDMNMPGMGGLEVLQGIRELDRRLPVILTTGYTDEDVTAAMAADPRLLLSLKPLTIEGFQRQLRTVDQLPD